MSDSRRRRLLDALKRLIRDGEPQDLVDTLTILSWSEDEAVEKFNSRIPGCKDAWECLSDYGRRMVIEAIRWVLLEKSLVPPRENSERVNIYLDICPILLRYAHAPLDLNCFKRPMKVAYVRRDLEGARKALERIMEALPEEVRGLRDCLKVVMENLIIRSPRTLPPINICSLCQKGGSCKKSPVLLNPCFFASPHFRPRLPELAVKQSDGQLLLMSEGFVVARLMVRSSGR